MRVDTQKYSPHLFKFYMRVDCFQILYRGEVSEATVTKLSMTTQTAFIDDTFVSPKSLKCNISVTNCLIALKFNTGVKYQKLHMYG